MDSYKNGGLKIKSGLLGLLLVALGVLLILINLDIIMVDIGSLAKTYWPALLVIWGVAAILEKIAQAVLAKNWGYGSSLLFPIIAISFALIHLGNNLNFFDKHISFWSILFPILLIFIGLKTLTHDKFSYNTEFDFDDTVEKESKRKKSNKGWKMDYRLLGEVEKGKHPWSLEDCDIKVMVGETKINLATALISEGETAINLSGIVGEIKIWVPEGLAVNIRTRVILGEVDLFSEETSGVTPIKTYKTPKYDEASKRVRIDIFLVLGEITVKWVE